MSTILEILMPRLNANDETFKLCEWLVEDGALVRPGQPLAALESSKAVSELVAEAEGFIAIVAEEFTDLPAGAVLARLSAESGAAAPEGAPPPAVEPLPNLTRRANELVARLELDPRALPNDRILRARDIQAIAVGTPGRASGGGLLIYPTGGTSLSVAEAALSLFPGRVRGFVDRNPAAPGGRGLEVVGGEEDLARLLAEGADRMAIALGSRPGGGGRKEKYITFEAMGFTFPAIVHPRAIVDDSAEIGAGSIVLQGAVVGPLARIGRNCLINMGAIISHDCEIGDHSHVASGAVLAGFVRVGENCLIGQGVTVYSRVEIGPDVTVYNGANVFNNIMPNATIKS